MIEGNRIFSEIKIVADTKTNETVLPDNWYHMCGNRINVKTQDLNLDFADIAKQLNRIVELHFDLDGRGVV